MAWDIRTEQLRKYLIRILRSIFEFSQFCPFEGWNLNFGTQMLQTEWEIWLDFRKDLESENFSVYSWNYDLSDLKDFSCDILFHFSSRVNFVHFERIIFSFRSSNMIGSEIWNTLVISKTPIPTFCSVFSTRPNQLLWKGEVEFRVQIEFRS